MPAEFLPRFARFLGARRARPSGRAILAAICALARFPALAETDADILASFEIREGFRLEIVATEPVVLDPVDLTWDENGALYVLEMPGYPIATETPDGKWPGRVVRIEDADGDGRFEKRTVFAEGFRYASSILAGRGGLYVADPPDLTFLKDSDGDGRIAETNGERTALLTGLRVGNSQHNFNGLCWGLDGKLYAANGGNSGTIENPARPGEPPIPLYWRDFRYDPEAKNVEIVGESTGGHGIAFDDWGRLFSTHNTAHVQMLVVPEKYLARNPHVPWRDAMVEIAEYREGGLSRVFPIGPPQTRVNHPEQSGYFSGACGIAFYDGGAWGAGFDGSLVVGDVVTNLVHRMRLRPEGPLFVASRPEGEERREFLASRDRRFRPVYHRTGPDGALYVVDFHRGEIEHPEWIPDELEKDMDVRAGEDQGRIFRIVPEAGLPLRHPRLRDEPSAALVERLGDPNRWIRDAAQRVLVERGEKEIAARLKPFAKNEKNPLARLHALWTLAGMGALGEASIRAALEDPHPGVRENALVLAEPLRVRTAETARAAMKSASHDDARVRFQAALTIGDLVGGEDEELSATARKLLLTIAERDARWPATRMAVASAFGTDADRALDGALASLEAGRFADSEGGRALLAALAETVGDAKRRDEVPRSLKLLAECADAEARLAGLAGLREGLARGDAPEWAAEASRELAEALAPAAASDDPRALRLAWAIGDRLAVPAGERRAELLAEAGRRAADEALDPAARRASLELYEFAPFDERAELLFRLLDPLGPPELQTEAVDQLSRGPNDAVVDRLLASWKSLGPGARRAAGNLLLYREQNHDRLLTALEDGSIPIGQMNMDLERRRVLLRAKSQSVRERAAKLFTDAGVVTRAQAIERMKPALALAGDFDRGATVFRENCAKCHRVGDEGHDVGPNLTEIFRKSGETLLHDVLDPNAAVDEEYMSYALALESGDIVNGLLAEQTATSVVLLEAEGKRTTYARESVKEMYSSGLSLMPEELESGIDPQAMADLLAFLQRPR